MADLALHGFLQALRRIIRALNLYPPEHPLTQEALGAALTSIDAAFGDANEFLLSVRDEGLYRNGLLLPHISLEFNGLIRDFQAREISSVTFRRPRRTGPTSPPSWPGGRATSRSGRPSS